MPADKYWLWINEQHWGPCSLKDIVNLAEKEDSDDPDEAPVVTRETLFWSGKTNEWKPVYRLQEEWKADNQNENPWTEGSKHFMFLASGLDDDCAVCKKYDREIILSVKPPPLPIAGCQCLWPKGIWGVVSEEEAAVPFAARREQLRKQQEQDRISAQAHAEALKARQKVQRKAKREAQKAQNKQC